MNKDNGVSIQLETTNICLDMKEGTRTISSHKMLVGGLSTGEGVYSERFSMDGIGSVIHFKPLTLAQWQEIAALMTEQHIALKAMLSSFQKG